ncbi:hypothetical protein QBC43DRAFT_315461 [Cladorrhinum sp. PSN259]|nr:hypothetical protein QBC43DRAFT_315461 [Cladorrhinum sp. PSN259]
MSLSQEAIIALVGLILALPPGCMVFRYCLRRSRRQPTEHADHEAQINSHLLSQTSLPAYILIVSAFSPSLNGPQARSAYPV